MNSLGSKCLNKRRYLPVNPYLKQEPYRDIISLYIYTLISNTKYSIRVIKLFQEVIIPPTLLFFLAV
jgi:hypothetical protein